jgi:hypothetical protein
MIRPPRCDTAAISVEPELSDPISASVELMVKPLTTRCSWENRPRSIATIAGKASQPLL